MSDEHKDNRLRGMSRRQERKLGAQIDKDNLRLIVGVSALLILTIVAALTLSI